MVWESFIHIDKGPTLVSKDLIPDPGRLKLKGLKNGKVMQECGCE
jgi:hypothetical protein